MLFFNCILIMCMIMLKNRIICGFSFRATIYFLDVKRIYILQSNSGLFGDFGCLYFKSLTKTPFSNNGDMLHIYNMLSCFFSFFLFVYFLLFTSAFLHHIRAIHVHNTNICLCFKINIYIPVYVVSVSVYADLLLR